MPVPPTLFTTAYDGANVRIEWKINPDAEVTGFELARKAATESSYTVVSNVAANGHGSYHFLDTNVYQTAAASTGSTAPLLASGPFTYRLTVLSPNGDQSYLTVLAGTPNAVQRSWATIKSMFR